MKRIAFIGLTISIVVAAGDAIFKYLAIQYLPEFKPEINHFFDLLLHKNPGIAFDIPLPLPLIVTLTIIITLALTIFIKRNWRANSSASLAAIMIIMGAIGNMFDRLINGFTTDYIILFGQSVINLSDILIISGTILLLWYTKNKDAVKN